MNKPTKHVYVLATGNYQWALPTNQIMEAQNVFYTLLPEMIKSNVAFGLLYSVFGGHFEEPLYGRTDVALKKMGHDIDFDFPK